VSAQGQLPPSKVPAARGPSGRPGPPGSHATPPIDPIRLLRENMAGIVIATAVGAVIAGLFFVGSLFLYPLYQSQSVFEIRNRLVDARMVRTTEFTDEETVARLATQEASRVTERTAMKQAIEGKAAVLDTAWIHDYPDDAGGINWDDAVDDLEDEVAAGHLRGTQQFYVQWRAHDDDDVIAVLHALEEHYLSEKRAQDRGEDQRNRAMVSAQKAQVDGQINDAQAEIVKLIGDSNLKTFDESKQQTLRTLDDMEVRMNEAAQQLQVLQSKVAIADAKLASGKGYSEDDRSVIQRDPVLMELRGVWVTYQTQLAAARARYGDNHFKLDELTRLEQAAHDQYDSLQEALLKDRVYGERAFSQYEIDGLDMVLSDLNSKRELERKALNEAAVAVSKLEEIRERKKRLEEESKALQSQLVDIDLVLSRPDAETVRLVFSALKPRELWFPKAKLVLPGVTLLIVSLYIGWLFMRELTDKRVRFPADLAGIPSAPRLLGVIPDEESDPDAPEDLARAVDTVPNGFLAESYRQTYGILSRQMRGQPNVVLALLAPTPSSGVSSCVCNLAMVARSTGKRVLVVEANLRRPALAAMLGTDPEAPGLGDLMNLGKPTEECIQPTADGIDIITAGTTPSRGVDRLYTPAFGELMAHLHDRYDLILVDVPPSIVAGEAASIAQAADATILVAHAFNVDKGLVQKVSSMLGDLGNQFFGAILFANRTTAGGYQRKNRKLIAGYSESGDDAEPEAAGT